MFNNVNGQRRKKQTCLECIPFCPESKPRSLLANIFKDTASKFGRPSSLKLTSRQCGGDCIEYPGSHSPNAFVDSAVDRSPSACSLDRERKSVLSQNPKLPNPTESQANRTEREQERNMQKLRSLVIHIYICHYVTKLLS